MEKFEYLKAQSLREAVDALARNRGKAAVLAGGTDAIPAMRRGKSSWKLLVDVKGIPSLGGIKAGSRAVSIGSLTTLAELASNPVIIEKLPVLSATALNMASPQVRNRGTVGGNLCNAAPSADLAPPLIVLGAKVKIVARGGERTIPIEEFFEGPGITAISGGRGILASVIIPLPKPGTKISFKTHTPRMAMDLSLVSVAAAVRRDKGRIAEARVALGACAPVPLRCRDAEEALAGTSGEASDAERAVEALCAAARPIGDVRASAGYRRDMAKEMARRALAEVLS